MSGLREVDCTGCGRHYDISAEQARQQRVLRCSCGQFVRLDRGLAEARSEPAPATAPSEIMNSADDDEQTHMLDSLAAVAALRGTARSRSSQPSLPDTSQRASRPAPRAPMPSLPPPPGSTPPPGKDKPLWYVDLGGSETVQMTIEQLIIARRSGKLGEGALVWREGMPRWRPVGTLIPATSVAARTPLPSSPRAATLPAMPPPPRSSSSAALCPAPAPPPPPVPRRSAPPPPPAVESPSSAAEDLGSYERPIATLEFALPTRPDRAPSLPARGLTPLPQPSTWNRSSRPAGSSSVAGRLPTPEPPLPAVTAPPAATTDFNSVRPTLPPEQPATHWFSDQPRWVTGCIALAVFVTASGSGALLVRSLRLHHQPASLATSVALDPATNTPASNPSLKAAAPESSAPLVVDLESLSVEPARPPRPRPIATAARVVRPTPEPASSDAGEHNSPPSADSAAPEASEPDLPSNPYGGTHESKPQQPRESDQSGL